MLNPVRFFRHPQEKIMVLAPVKTGSHSADFFQQGFSDHRQVTHIIVTDQGIRTIVRLVMRIHMPSAVLGDPVLIGINHIRVFIRNTFRHPPQCIRGQQIVMVAQGNVFSLCKRHRFVCIAADAPVFRSADHPEAVILFTFFLQYSQCFSPGTRTVIQDCLKIRIALFPEAVQQLGQHNRICIVYRYYHADQPGSRLVFPLRFQLFLRRTFPHPPPVIAAQQLLGSFLAQAFQRIRRAMALLVFPNPLNPVHAHSSVFLLILPKSIEIEASAH